MNYIDYMQFDGETKEDLLYYLTAICRITDGGVKTFYWESSSVYITIEDRETDLDVMNLECISDIIWKDLETCIFHIAYNGVFQIIQIRKKT